MRKLFAALLTFTICLTLLTPALAAGQPTYRAIATNNPIVVSNSADTPDAHLVHPTVYKIEGYNYFKLRDVAMLLRGSDRQFEVDYDDAAKTVSITSGKPYTARGGELSGTAAESAAAIVSNNAILIDGKSVTLTVFKIDGSNYFRLRDLGKALDFRVGYDEQTAIVYISGARGYEEDPAALTVKTAWANYTDDDAIKRGARNAELLGEAGPRRLPIYLFGSRSELDAFRNTFADTLTFDQGYDEVPSFDAVAAAYDDAFFEAHSLALVYVAASSCTFRFGVNEVRRDGTCLCIDAVQLNHPETYDTAMAGWFLLVELGKTDMRAYTAFDAQLVSGDA